VDLIQLAEDSPAAVSCEQGNEFLDSMQSREFFYQLATITFSTRTLLHGISSILIHVSNMLQVLQQLIALSVSVVQ
jgi:hypothetical protein